MWISVYFPPLLLSFWLGRATAGYTPLPVDVEELRKQGVTDVFTAEELLQYNGEEEGKSIYMSVKGVVFDVTLGKNFYAKGEDYHGMAGKDVSRAMATQNLEEADYIPDLGGLTDAHLEALDRMFEHVYLRKYKIVGLMDYVVKEHEAKVAAKQSEEKKGSAKETKAEL